MFFLLLVSPICLEINAFLLLDILSSYYETPHVGIAIDDAVFISNRCQLSCKYGI